MKRKCFSVDQITAVLKQAQGGIRVATWVARPACVRADVPRWKNGYGGMLPMKAREVKQLREENARLKRVVADLTLDKVMLQDIVQTSSKACQAA